jgi:hypothetical protein
VALPVGSIAFAFFGITIGLITGLIVVMIPLYVLFVQATVSLMLVSLCMKVAAPTAARVVGAVGLLAPVAFAALRYGAELLLCDQGPEAAACRAYINGDPPLVPVGLVLYAGISVGAAVTFFVVMARFSIAPEAVGEPR